MFATKRGLVFLLACAALSANAAESLTIGSQAPPIDIEHWLGERRPVAEFEPGKVYVIEFWATWCGPCIGSMPHLRDLQARHGNDIVVIGVSDESTDTIEAFLDRDYEGKTFREITNQYWLATDPDGSVKQDYMRAADQHGIPTAFVIGKTGDIEWIGHPMRIDEPVARILANSWDREAYKREREEEQRVRSHLRLVAQHAQKKDYAKALALLDTLLAGTSSAELRRSLEAAKQRINAEADASRQVQPGRTQRFGTADVRRLAIGDHVTIEVTGRVDGWVWGDSVYTLDSDPGAAAVHAGVLRVGETRPIRVWVVPAPTAFTAALRNGVQSRPWGAYPAAFVMQAVEQERRPDRPQIVFRSTSVIERLQPGESMTIPLTGSDRGTVWGTDTYTGDSPLEVAAVHAGALRIGERAAVIITRVEPLGRYERSNRNGVQSNAWGGWPTAFTIERKVEGGP